MPTTTTNYALNLPTVGSDDDQWGSYLNTNFTKIDTQLKTLSDSIADQDLEELGNVVNTTPAEDQVLQFNGQNWSASTLAISDIAGLQAALDGKADDSDLTGITTNPADGSISYAKLNTALKVQVDRILLTDDDASPTDNQILKYSKTDSKWKYADLPGSTIQTLSDVNTAALADDAMLVYNSTEGEFRFESGSTLRTTLGVDVSGTDNSSPVTLSGSLDYLTLSGQAITLQQINLTTDVTDTLPVANGGTGSATASDARTALGLAIGSDVQAYDAGLNDISSLAVTDGNIIVGDGSNWVAESGSTARASLGVTIGSQVQAWDQQLDDISALAVTDGNIIVGNGTTWVAESGSTARASLGVSIGSQVQAWDQQLDDISALAVTDGNIIVGNGTTWVAESGATARASLGLTIGTDVQAYDADTAKYDDTTANFTGTLQNGGSNVVVDSDIGSSVQAYDANTVKTNVSNSFTTNQIITSSSNSNPALRVTQTGVADALRIEDQSNPDSTPFIIDTFGRVGIGVSTASDILHIEGSSSPAIRLRDTQVANTYSQISASNNSLTINADAGNDAASGSLSIKISDITKLLINKTNGVVLYDDLVVNGNSIVSTSGGNISITPDTTGKIVLDGLSWPTADGSADQVLKTDGAGNLSFVDQSGGGGSGSSYIEHSSTVSDSLEISAGTNRMYIGGTTFSGSGTMAGRLVTVGGAGNFTGSVNTTGVLVNIGVP